MNDCLFLFIPIHMPEIYSLNRNHLPFLSSSACPFKASDSHFPFSNILSCSFASLIIQGTGLVLYDLQHAVLPLVHLSKILPRLSQDIFNIQLPSGSGLCRFVIFTGIFSIIAKYWAVEAVKATWLAWNLIFLNCTILQEQLPPPPTAKCGSLEKGQTGLNFKLSYTELTKSSGRRKQLSRSWVCKTAWDF